MLESISKLGHCRRAPCFPASWSTRLLDPSSVRTESSQRCPQTHTNAFTWLTQGKLEEGAQNSEGCRVHDPGKQNVAEVLGEPGGREP